MNSTPKVPVYNGVDGAELYYCDAFAAFDDPDEHASTNDEIHWAVWSFDARVDGFGLYMSHAQPGLVGRSFLNADTWADAGEFPTNQQNWENSNTNGDDWVYARPFDLGAAGCRQ